MQHLAFYIHALKQTHLQLDLVLGNEHLRIISSFNIKPHSQSTVNTQTDKYLHLIICTCLNKCGLS